MTSAGEILALRRALLNPVTCHQFRRFVSLKGDFLENDVLFWLEVQRYKVRLKPNLLFWLEVQLVLLSLGSTLGLGNLVLLSLGSTLGLGNLVV